jgi:hypothetical protein
MHFNAMPKLTLPRHGRPQRLAARRTLPLINDEAQGFVGHLSEATKLIHHLRR